MALFDFLHEGHTLELGLLDGESIERIRLSDDLNKLFVKTTLDREFEIIPTSIKGYFDAIEIGEL